MSKAFGEQNPTAGEDAVSWQTWSDGAAGIPDVVGDIDWGKLKLDFNPVGEEGRSAVYDLGSSKTRKFTISENRYGTGTEDATIQIRGDTDIFLQDDNLPTWETYTIPISRNWQYVQIRATTFEPRFGLWVWASDLKTQANCDALITYATGKFTDLFVFAIDDSVSPKTWLGTGADGYGASNATVIDGKTPWQYVYDAAHAVGIRVHAWLWLLHFAYWGGSTGIETTIPDNATYNDAGYWNFHNGTARDKMNSMIQYFCEHNSMDGVNFNLEGTTANILIADTTEWLTELRALVPLKEFSFDVGGKLGDDTNLKIDTANWLDADLLDSVASMIYYESLGKSDQFKASLNLINKIFYTCIISHENGTPYYVCYSDFGYRLKQLEDNNELNLVVFNWNKIKSNNDIKTRIEAYLAGTIENYTDYGNITKVAHVQGTSFAITVDGSDQTTLYADVSDHLYSDVLKEHIEAALGTTTPATYYRREGSTYTYLSVGDFEP